MHFLPSFSKQYSSDVRLVRDTTVLQLKHWIAVRPLMLSNVFVVVALHEQTASVSDQTGSILWGRVQISPS